MFMLFCIGKFFKTCMVLGDFYHTSEFGPFESQAGEMVAFIGSDSESKHSSCVDICPLLQITFLYRVEFGGTFH